MPESFLERTFSEHRSNGLKGKLFRLSKRKSSDSLADAKVPFHFEYESEAVLSRRRTVCRAWFAYQGASLLMVAFIAMHPL